MAQTAEESLHARLIDAALRAPSSHNTQPWRFERTLRGIRLRADRMRRLPVNDPDDRELLISCGAALFHLRVAAAAVGRGTRVALLPDAEDTDALADVTPTHDAPDEDLAVLFSAIDRRHTCRGGFDAQPVSPTVVRAMEDAAAAEGARLLRLDEPDERARVAAFVAAGDRRQFANTAWREELVAWMRPRGAPDGLVSPGAAGRLVLRSLNVGRLVAAADARRARHAPALALLGTPGDEPFDWIAAGQALERALLVAAARGIQAAFLNQPCQVAALRPKLAAAFPAAGHPQLLLVLGHPRRTRAPPARRRPRESVAREGRTRAPPAGNDPSGTA